MIYSSSKYHLTYTSLCLRCFLAGVIENVESDQEGQLQDLQSLEYLDDDQYFTKSLR